MERDNVLPHHSSPYPLRNVLTLLFPKITRVPFSLFLKLKCLFKNPFRFRLKINKYGRISSYSLNSTWIKLKVFIKKYKKN